MNESVTLLSESSRFIREMSDEVAELVLESRNLIVPISDQQVEVEVHFLELVLEEDRNDDVLEVEGEVGVECDGGLERVNVEMLIEENDGVHKALSVVQKELEYKQRELDEAVKRRSEIEEVKVNLKNKIVEL